VTGIGDSGQAPSFRLPCSGPFHLRFIFTVDLDGRDCKLARLHEPSLLKAVSMGAQIATPIIATSLIQLANGKWHVRNPCR
jgi:hypothetical protein